jgi:orotidine-5'-phosphate decarboxylase
VSFSAKIKEAAERNRSKIVLALDLEGPEPRELAIQSKRIIRRVSKYICAVKINRQLVLPLGLRGGVESIVKLAHDLSLPTIMDAKLNDVGHTNEFIARSYFDAGFDAIIASPLVGWENGLDKVFSEASSRDKAVILLVYMSNPGAEVFYSMLGALGKSGPKPVFEHLSQMAVEWKAEGVIVGATKPKMISRVRELVGRDLAIYSPGVGAQGGNPREALDAGSTYLIVGRAIYNAADPEKVAAELRDLT